MAGDTSHSRTMFRAIRAVVPFLLLATAGILIWLGIQRGEMRIVLNKAIRICLECVGLG